MNFIKSKLDPSLFIHRHSKGTVYLIYVDGIILTQNNAAMIKQLISSLSSCFSLKDLDSLTYFLSIEIYRDKK